MSDPTNTPFNVNKEIDVIVSAICADIDGECKPEKLCEDCVNDKARLIALIEREVIGEDEIEAPEFDEDTAVISRNRLRKAQRKLLNGGEDASNN